MENQIEVLIREKSDKTILLMNDIHALKSENMTLRLRMARLEAKHR